MGGGQGAQSIANSRQSLHTTCMHTLFVTYARGGGLGQEAQNMTNRN